MALNPKMLSKVKGKMPAAKSSREDAEDGADPMFDIPEGEDADDAPNASSGGAPDSGHDERTAARAEDGDESSMDDFQEGDADDGDAHEESEGEAEKALEKVSTADLAAELARRHRKGRPDAEDADKDESDDEGKY